MTQRHSFTAFNTTSRYFVVKKQLLPSGNTSNMMFNSTSFTLTINSSFIIYLVILYFQQLPLLVFARSDHIRQLVSIFNQLFKNEGKNDKIKCSVLVIAASPTAESLILFNQCNSASSDDKARTQYSMFCQIYYERVQKICSLV